MEALLIPKFELQEALLAYKLNEGILRALLINVTRTFLWIDSSAMLQWLHSYDKNNKFCRKPCL